MHICEAGMIKCWPRLFCCLSYCLNFNNHVCNHGTKIQLFQLGKLGKLQGNFKEDGKRQMLEFLAVRNQHQLIVRLENYIKSQGGGKMVVWESVIVGTHDLPTELRVAWPVAILCQMQSTCKPCHPIYRRWDKYKTGHITWTRQLTRYQPRAPSPTK